MDDNRSERLGHFLDTPEETDKRKLITTKSFSSRFAGNSLPVIVEQLYTHQKAVGGCYVI